MHLLFYAKNIFIYLYLYIFGEGSYQNLCFSPLNTFMHNFRNSLISLNTTLVHKEFISYYWYMLRDSSINHTWICTASACRCINIKSTWDWSHRLAVLSESFLCNDLCTQYWITRNRSPSSLQLVYELSACIPLIDLWQGSNSQSIAPTLSSPPASLKQRANALTTESTGQTYTEFPTKLLRLQHFFKRCLELVRVSASGSPWPGISSN